MNDSIKEYFTDAPSVLSNAFMRIYKDDTLIINVENGDKILSNSDRILIDEWIWEHDDMLIDEFNVMDIEVNHYG